MTEEGRALAIVLGLLVGLAAIGIALGFYNSQAPAAGGADEGKGARARRRRPISDRR